MTNLVSASRVAYKDDVLLNGKVDPYGQARTQRSLPCGSGKKYKACCLTRDETAEREELAKAQAGRESQAANCYRQLIAFVRQHPDDFDAEIADDYTARVAKLDPPAAS